MSRHASELQQIGEDMIMRWNARKRYQELTMTLTLGRSVERAVCYRIGDGTAQLNRGAFGEHRKQPPKRKFTIWENWDVLIGSNGFNRTRGAEEAAHSYFQSDAPAEFIFLVMYEDIVDAKVTAVLSNVVDAMTADGKHEKHRK
ncbi:unnamed protein product [Cyprideis torosa]|uniref:Uncharacterized protein n=1 Tax=Cyprideis torosa TaxID=163714 RepID=A0A7R8ZRE7_9CRUS|nr:unnamed protein product [Cyprideis torosa]CAG0894073.1 unnamed protein product [Cyprideis torosa]